MRNPKPSIRRRRGGKWILRYHFRPRMMWLFGASPEERRAIYDQCLSEIEFDEFAKALESLRLAYRCNQVER